MKQAVDAYDFLEKQMAECDQRLQMLLAALPQREVRGTDVHAEATTAGESANRKQKWKNPAQTEMRRDLFSNLSWPESAE